MKKILQLTLFSVFLFVSCISDNMDDCVVMRTLVFKHHCLYDSNESFDQWVGNDVMLYVFQDKVLKMREIIPYERIKDGKPYSYPKHYGGDIDIVAWSVPKGSTTAIPQYGYGDLFSEQYVMHEEGTDNYNAFPIDLYLGVDSLNNDVVTMPTTHLVRMIHCANLINITINDPEGVMQAFTENYVSVSGVMEQMNLHYDGCGQRAVIRESVEGSRSFETGYFGVLPSAGNQTLSFALYGDGQPLAIITTDMKAMPGGRMELTINLGVSVSITVNDAGWDFYPVSVQWM